MTKTNPAQNAAASQTASQTKDVPAPAIAGSRDSVIYASRSGHRIDWALSSSVSENNIDHFEILLATGDRQVREIGRVPAEARDYDLANTPGEASSKVYIKAVEKNGHMAHVSNMVSLGRDIQVAGLADGALVTSPIHVMATATSDQPVTEVQVYLDGLLVSSQQFDHIDALVSADTGTRRLTIAGWDLAGHEFKKSMLIKVQQPGLAARPVDSVSGRRFVSLKIQKPSDGSAVATPTARLVVDANSAQPISALSVYCDDDKILTVKTGHLDTAVALEIGSHRLTVKAEDKAGHSSEAYVYVERLPEKMALGDSDSGSKVR